MSGGVSETCDEFTVSPSTYSLTDGQSRTFTVTYAPDNCGNDICEVDLGACGILICDYFSANKKFVQLSKALVQYCWAHLIRDIKFLLTLGHRTLERWADALLNVLRKIFELWKTRHHRHQRRYKKAIEKLKKAFLQKVRRPPSHNEAVNIKKRFIDCVEKC